MHIKTLRMFCILMANTFISLYGMESEEQAKMEIAQPFIDYVTFSGDAKDDSSDSAFCECTTIAHHPYQRKFALGTSRGNIQLWEDTSDAPGTVLPTNVATLNLFEAPIKHLAYNPKGTKLAVAYKNCLHVIRIANQKIIHTLQEKSDISTAVFDCDGKVLIYSTHTLPIALWEPKINYTYNKPTFNLPLSDLIIRSRKSKRFISKNQDKVCTWNFHVNGDLDARDITMDNLSGQVVLTDKDNITMGRTNGALSVLNVKGHTTLSYSNSFTANKSITALAYCALLKKILMTTQENPDKIIFTDRVETGFSSLTPLSDNETVERSVFSEDGTRLIQLINQFNRKDNSNKKFLRYTVIGSGKEALSNFTVDELQAMAKEFKE